MAFLAWHALAGAGGSCGQLRSLSQRSEHAHAALRQKQQRVAFTRHAVGGPHVPLSAASPGQAGSPLLRPVGLGTGSALGAADSSLTAPPQAIARVTKRL